MIHRPPFFLFLKGDKGQPSPSPLILESLKYILKKEGFYNPFVVLNVVLKKGYRKIKKVFFTP